MKKHLLFIPLLLLFACSKDKSVQPVQKKADVTTTQVKSNTFAKSNALASNVDGNGVTTDVTYRGGSSYEVRVRIPSSIFRANSGYTFQIYGANSSSSNGLFPYTDQTRILDVTVTLQPGSYYVYYSDGGDYSGNATTFIISAKPVSVSTAGYVPLYRYYNSNVDKHLYTVNWEELGGCSKGYALEGIEGYIYDNAARASNLVPLYRFDNPTTSDNFLAPSSTVPVNYTAGGIIGYISTVSAGSMDSPFNEYFSTGSGHLYVTPPEVPAPPAVNDAFVGYIIPNHPDVLSGGLIPLFRYYNPTLQRHVYTSSWNELGTSYAGYTFEKIQGYMYDNPGRAGNLVPLYRYNNPTTHDHFLHTALVSISGYTYERIEGYISSVSTSTFNQPLNQYFNTTLGHIYISPPESLASASPAYQFEETKGYLNPTAN